jgi:hypothetical protein
MLPPTWSNEQPTKVTRRDRAFANSTVKGERTVGPDAAQKSEEYICKIKSYAVKRAFHNRHASLTTLLPLQRPAPLTVSFMVKTQAIPCATKENDA